MRLNGITQKKEEMDFLLLITILPQAEKKT